MPDNKLELIVEVDVARANASIKSINRGLSSFEQAAAKAGRGAAQGIDGFTVSVAKGAAAGALLAGAFEKVVGWAKEAGLEILKYAARTDTMTVVTSQLAKVNGYEEGALARLDFARFLEENMPDVVEPNSAELLQVALTFEAKKSVFKEPMVFDNDEERKEAARVLARWHALLARNAAGHGWSYDKLSDLARILRIPGTRNLKDLASPKAVTILSVNDRRYNLSDFEEFLDREGVLDAKAQETAAQEWVEKFADKRLVVDLTKRIAQDRIDIWVRDDMRFRNTWLRQRHDLKDQSQSGYDLALACFGMDAGLSERS